MGGAAAAVLLIVFGTGTLGVLPAMQVRGHVVDPAAAISSTSNEAATDFGPGVLVDVAEAPAGLIADQSTYEEREAQFTTALPDQRAQVAIGTAMAQIGLPYVWGGDGPTNGDAGFDCSGLTTFSYAAAGVSLPRTAHTQYYKGPHVPQGAALRPGDLVFYGTPAKVHHVGMYLGDGKMVNAPTFGKPVRTAFYRYGGDDYLGATRPAATGQTTSGLLPYAPAAPSTGTQETFPAPVAPAPTAVPDVTAPQPAESVSAAEATAAAVTATVTVAPPTPTSSSAPAAVPSSSTSATASSSPTTPTSSRTPRPRPTRPVPLPPPPPPTLPPPPPVTVTVTVSPPAPEPTSPALTTPEATTDGDSADVLTTTTSPAP
jgi:cell wall-associated NlpC family hydrolase